MVRLFPVAAVCIEEISASMTIRVVPGSTAVSTVEFARSWKASQASVTRASAHSASDTTVCIKFGFFNSSVNS